MKKTFIKSSIVKSALCLVLVLALCLGDVTPMFRRTDVKAEAAAAAAASSETAKAASAEVAGTEQSEGVIRPEDIDEGLSLNSLDDIRGRRVTVRQPVMEILRNDIVRPHPAEMENEYTMLDLETGKVMNALAKIDFSQGGDREVGNKDHPMYPMRGLERSDKDADGKVSKQKYFSEFTKYMLLRQAYYFNTHYSEIITKGELKKHLAADYIYGKISDEVKAASMHIVTDPIYRSPMTTGLYLAPGEAATVKIKGLKQGETLTLYTHHQDTMGYLGYNEDGKGFGTMEAYLGYWDEKIVGEAERAAKANDKPNFDKFNYGIHGQWQWQNQKVPCMGTTYTFVGTGRDMEVKIGSMYGGPLYIRPTTDSVDLVIDGAILTPHFVLGVTTVDEFEKQLRDAPGLIATLDVENGQLIGPADAMKNCDDIEKLAYFWHSVFAIDISLNGRDYNYNMTMCYDLHVPAGEAVALNSNFCAQPEYWFPTCMTYEKLTTSGNWGTFHELGHVQAKTHGVNWGFCDGDGEVWNNTLILLIYSMLCNMDTRVVKVEHGEYVHPFTAIERSQNITKEYKDKTTQQMVEIKDYGQINEGNGAHFDQLSMYATLLHSFGPEKFVDMFYTYKMNPAYCANKRADFVYRIGVVDRVNILDWVNKNYFANIKDEMFSDAQLEFLHNLPTFVPVAYRWANGIDGHETARKYDVDGKHPTVFDLSEKNFSSPGEVEVIAVTGGRHGTLDYREDEQKVIYTPTEIAEYDSFDIIVKTEGGRRVTLNVNMRLVYKGLYGEVWVLGQSSEVGKVNVKQALDKIKDTPKSYTVSSAAPGLSFNNQDTSKGYNPVEYLHMQFKYRAPEAGNYIFYAKADDYAEIDFYRNDMSRPKEGTINITWDTTSYTKFSPVKMNLMKGEVVFVDCHLVNWGGQGHMTVGVHLPDAPADEIVALPSEDLLSADLQESELRIVDEFEGWQPRFVDSIKNATIDYRHSNGEWTVLSAPVSEGGDSETVQEQYRNYMVDGDETTAYHTKYNHGTGATVVKTPHEFVIDTSADQTFNYFDIIRRTNGNDKLLSYDLYGCAGSEYSVADGVDTSNWKLLFSGESSNVNAARQRLSFSRTQVRYFKLVITANSGHTVIKEVSAGIESKLSQTVKPRNYMKNPDAELAEEETAGFVENPANGKLSTKKAGATFEFDFLGNGFELYADTNPGYGKASVSVNGVEKDEIDLRDEPIFNKMVFTSGELETAEYHVVVTTLEVPFNISFINVRYGTPVAADEYPATQDEEGNEDYGDKNVARQFSREWKTYVKDYKELTSIKFLTAAPTDYKDTYVRFDTYIRLYRYKNEDTKENKIAFVYPGTILAPIECGSLFSGCEALEELVLENFDTKYMRGAMNMFYGCSSLKNLDVSEFKTENVLSFGKMFGNCTGLDTVDLGNFKVDENANFYRLFENCTELGTIELPKTVNVKKTRSGAADDEADEIRFELPYVYKDENTGAYVTEIVLDADTAGHRLTLHKDHEFTEAETYEQQDPNCLETGTIAYKTCSVCRCDFDVTEGKTLYRDGDLIIPATGHHFEYDYLSAGPNDYPTCSKPGRSGFYRCENDGCDATMGEVEGIPPIGHSYRLDDSKGEGKGYTVEFFRREEIEKTEMIDEDGESYYVQEELVVKGIAKVTFYLVCQGVSDYILGTPCDHTTKVVFEFECENHTEETCTDAETFFFDFSIDLSTFEKAMVEQDDEDKYADGISPSSFRTVTLNEVLEGEEIEGGHKSLGHRYETVEAVSPTCEGYGSTAGRKCAVCGIVDGVTEIKPLDHQMEMRPALDPTCTTAGHSAGEVCTRCGKEGAGVQHYEPLGHAFTVDIEEEAPTCTHVGHTSGKKCARCDAIEGYDVVDDLGHEAEIIPGKNPTKTESGLTDGLRCSRCGEILQAQEEIPALGGPKLSAVACAMIALGSVAAAAAVVTAVLVIRKKRRGKKS